jgi:hydrogenase maturation protein HypF
VVLDGPEKTVDMFVDTLAGKLPAAARLEDMQVVSRVSIDIHKAAAGFEIRRSSADGSMRISIPADLAMCAHCRSEVFDPRSRFYRYAFTTCTDCGPRYTVVEGMPYDRERTALRDFPLCSACLSEYRNRKDRRFHAESIACPVCGPRLSWADESGVFLDVEDPLSEARHAVSQGKIVAVKGLGGFLLVADARNTETLFRLRERKYRPAKPFAVMARSLEVLAGQCSLSGAEKSLLLSSAAPITVLETLPESTLPLDLLSPELNTLGVMLPTTPLHALLAEQTGDDPVESFDFLLMTSGNRGGEPVCISNTEAFNRLRGIADCFLCHNRRINLRNDDSLAVVNNGVDVQVWRRARGYAPSSIRVSGTIGRTVIAMGAELKNTICLGFDSEAVLSPHIGNLETPEALDALEQVVNSFPAYFNRVPDAVAVDLHPDMHSTRLGRAIAKKYDIPVVEIQHHYAHALSAMCEHRLDEAIALVFDGTGLGTDGTIWGGELLHVFPGGWKRLGTLAPSPLSGGDAAVNRPAKQLAARFWQQGFDVDSRWRSRMGVSENELALWKAQYERKLNTFSSHAAGRVFDAFSAGLGVSPKRVSYEGQAAILLESRAGRSSCADVPDLDFRVGSESGLFVVDLSPVFVALHRECPSGDQVNSWALAFHRTMVGVALSMVRYAEQEVKELPVVLSGGVMMNRLFVSDLSAQLKARGIKVFTHSLVPPNDGGISLGQIYANRGDC